MNKIYLDNAATTKPSEKVLAAMAKVNEEAWGNPSSIHTIGQNANSKLHEAREIVADFLNCDFQEVLFTGGGSESDNLAIRGIAQSSQLNAQGKPHIITSETEHHAVLHTVLELEKGGVIEATYLAPDSDGVIEPNSVREALKKNTVLVTLMYVNNETGVKNPIAEIGKIIKEENEKRQSGDQQQIYFHTDAVQAAEWEDMNVESLGVDLLTFTGHKMHGPKGVGVLYVRKGTPIKPQITGGGQEFKKRAGTENVAGIAGLAEAINELKAQSTKHKTVESLRDKLVAEIVKNIPDAIINGSQTMRAPHIANISFINAEGEAIILNLDFLGIAVSSGSACTSKSLAPSHVLTAMGIPPEKAHGSIRFSLSRYTTEEEIDEVIRVLPPIIKKLREMSPFKS